MQNLWSALVPEWAVKRILKVVVKTALGRFIHEPDLSQLDYKNEIRLTNLRLKVEAINEKLKDVPFTLSSGFIEEIVVELPLMHLLSQSIRLSVNGLELNFKLKGKTLVKSIAWLTAVESMSPTDAMSGLSSMLTESFLADRNDPSVLASSILIGDVRKCDIDSEFDNKSEELGESEGVIAQLIERIVSNLKASVTNATFRFEFPSQNKPRKNNILLFHFPRLDYADETPVPTGNDSWYPSMFIYKFSFDGFFVQLFEEDVNDKQYDSMMSSSIIVNDQNNQNDARLLDEGNTIIFGRAEDNKIRIKIIPPDNNKRKKIPDNKSCVEIQFNVSSIHSVFTPSKLKIMIEILQAISNCMTTAEQPDRNLRLSIPPPTHNHRSVHETIEKSIEKPVIPMTVNFESMHSDNTSMQIADSMFKPVDDFESDDEDSFYSIDSHEEEKRSSAARCSDMDDVKLQAFSVDDDFSALESSHPVSLQAVLQIQEATINLLYEDADLTNMWKKFRAKKSRGEGPDVWANHLSLQCSLIVVKSDNHHDKNVLEIAVGEFGLVEKVRKKAESPTLSNSQIRIMTDYFGSKQKTPQKPEFDEYKIVEFLNGPSASRNAPQIAITIEFNRAANLLDFGFRMDPVKLNLEASIVDRLVTLYKDVKQAIKEDKKKMQQELSSDTMNDIMIDIDSEIQPFTTIVELNFELVRVFLSFPDTEKYADQKIQVDLSSMKMRSDKIRQDSEQVVFTVKIDNIAVFLVDPGKAERIINTQPLTVTIISSKKQEQSRLPDSVYDAGTTVQYSSASDADIDLDTTSSSISDISDEEYASDDMPTPIEDMEYTVDRTVSDEKSFRSAAIALFVSASGVAIEMTKPEFILFQQLLQIFIKGVTNPLEQLNSSISEETTTPVSSSVKGSRHIFENFVIDSDKSEPNPETALKITLKALSFKIKKPNEDSSLPSNTCTVEVGDVSGHVMMYPESKIRVNLCGEELALLYSLLDESTKSEKQYEVLRKSNRLVRDFRDNTSAFVVSLFMKQQNPTLQKISVQLQTSGLYLNHYFFPENKDWTAVLSEFFSSDAPVEGDIITTVNIVLRDTVVDYSPINLPSKLLVSVDKIKLSTQMVQSAEEMALNLEIAGVYILLNNSFKHDILYYLKTRNIHSELGFMSDLKNLRFAQIVFINRVDIVAKILATGVEPTKKKPPVLVEVSNGTMTIGLCSDSLQTLTELLSYIGSNGDNPKPVVIPVIKEKATTPKKKEDFTVQIHNPDFLSNLDQNAFSPQKTREKKTQETNNIYPSILEDSINGGLSGSISINHDHFSGVDNKLGSSHSVKSSNINAVLSTLEADDDVVQKLRSYSWVHDYFPMVHDDKAITRELGSKYPIPKIEFLLNDQLNVVVTIYAGKDWGEKSTGTRSRSNSDASDSGTSNTTTPLSRSTRDLTQAVQVNLLDCFAQFHLFENSSNVWRFRLSIKDVEVIDKVKSSNRNKIICYWNSPEFPRVDGSRMLDLVYECVEPTPGKQEIRAELDVLPIRINLHQHTLYFLLRFADFPFIPKETQSATDQENQQQQQEEQQQQSESSSAAEKEEIFFQSFRISQLIFNIDYQPTDVDYGTLRQGSKIELLNFIPLNGVEVRLSNIDLLGIRGVDELIENLVEAWMPDIYGTKTFRFLLGIMPIRSLYNVGSGVADLFVLPIQHYQKDGRVLRGVRQGITSFVTNASVESVSLSANTASGLNYVVSAVNNYLSGTSSPARSSDAPATNFTEGLQKAYVDLNDTYNVAKYAILTIPKDENGAAIGALRAIPRVVLSPLVGLTSAASDILGALETSLRTDSKDDFTTVLYKHST